MTDSDLYPAPSDWAAQAHMNAAAYGAARIAARETPDAFRSEKSHRLDWITPPTSTRDVSFDRADFRIRWLGDGVLNVAWNCRDRHLAQRGEETAIICEGDEPTSGGLTCRELHAEVCQMANVLKGLVKGDRVTVYLPMIPAAVVAMLACTRIGA